MTKDFIFRAKLFDYARTHIPSYKHFLAANKMRLKHIASEEDFKKLPFTDKNSYFKKYPRRKLFREERLPAMAYASSGSSGKPTFWFREEAQELVGAAIHERILRDGLKIKPEEPTLIIICFGMGIWIAGHYTFASFKHLARQKYRLSIITPALEKEDTLRIIKELSPEFRHTVLVGYPSFIMDLLDEAARRKVVFPKSTKILTSGDTFAESWRDEAARRIRSRDVFHDIINIYGSADTTVLGHETPLSIFIRRAAVKNPALARTLWGSERGESGLVQYDPSRAYFEEVNGELAVTAGTTSPLIRYNLHDRGSVIMPATMRKILKEHGQSAAAQKYSRENRKLPFVVLKGRTDVAVTFYAINIFPEHARFCADVKSLNKYLSGNYLVYAKNIRGNHGEQLWFKLELRNGVRATPKMLAEAAGCIFRKLQTVNSEFRRLYSALGAKVRPRAVLVAPGMLKLPPHARGMLVIKGKKPRVMVL